MPALDANGMEWYVDNSQETPRTLNEEYVKKRIGRIGAVMPLIGRQIIGRKYNYGDLKEVLNPLERNFLIDQYANLDLDFTVTKLHVETPTLRVDLMMDRNILWEPFRTLKNKLELVYYGTPAENIILELYDGPGGPRWWIRLSDFMFFLSVKHPKLFLVIEKAYRNRATLQDMAIRGMIPDRDATMKIASFLRPLDASFDPIVLRQRKRRTRTRKKRSRKSKRKRKKKTRRR